MPSIAAAAMPLAAQSTSDRRRLPSSYSRASITANVADNRSELASDTRRQPYRSHGANCASVKNTGIRSWISPANSFGSVMIIVQDFSRSLVARSFHSSQRPAAVRTGVPSRAVKYHGCLPPGVVCHSYRSGAKPDRAVAEFFSHYGGGRRPSCSNMRISPCLRLGRRVLIAALPY